VWRLHKEQGGDFYFHSKRKEDSGQTFYETTEAVRSVGSVAIVYHFREPALGNRLKEFVVRGALPGRIDPAGRVILGSLLPEHYRLMLLPEAGLLDTWGSYQIVKLPPDLEPCKKGEKSK
jgi:hypothetical protein